MTKAEILRDLKSLLKKLDVDAGDILTRQRHHDYDSDIAVLLGHLRIVMGYLQFDAEACRRETHRLAGIVERLSHPRAGNDGPGVRT